MRVRLNTRSTRGKISDRKATFNLNDRRSKVRLNLDVIPSPGVISGIFDETFDLTFE
jgi:hypothetical protein